MVRTPVAPVRRCRTGWVALGALVGVLSGWARAEQYEPPTMFPPSKVLPPELRKGDGFEVTGDPSMSLEEAARRRLQAALAWIEDPERFVVEVSEAARNYLEGRFGLRAPERTTEEFLAELSGSVALDGRHKELLADFLTRCDLVKFARAVVDRSELQGLHQAAVRLVEETVPSPHGPAAPPPMPPRQR